VSIDLLVQALLNGFGLAMVYVLVALGLTLIFSILEIINFAHGEFYMLGGYVTYYAYALFGLNYFATLGLAILTVGVAGVVAERLIFHDLRGKALNAFIVSLGLLWVMQAGAQLAFGVLDKPVPSAFSGIVRVLGLVISVERLVVTLSAIVLIIALYLFLRLSRPGRAMRAVAFNRTESMRSNHSRAPGFASHTAVSLGRTGWSWRAGHRARAAATSLPMRPPPMMPTSISRATAWVRTSRGGASAPSPASSRRAPRRAAPVSSPRDPRAG